MWPTSWSLNVADTARAQTFYRAVFGWTFSSPGSHGGIHVEGSSGGLHAATLGVSTVALFVDDIDKAAQRVRELGGQADDPRGELAVVYAEATDPAGTQFGLVSFGPTHLPPSPAPTSDGHLGY